MTRDAKIIQRGINNTANDLAVPAGTMTDGKNLAFDRDGVAARRPGHRLYSTGLPVADMFEGYTDENAALGYTRGVYSLFSDTHAFHLNQSVMFALDDVSGTETWLPVPVNLPHRWRPLGTTDTAAGTLGRDVSTLGRMLIGNFAGTAWTWQNLQTNMFVGAIGNDASAATDSTAVQNVKFRTCFDVVSLPISSNIAWYASDETNIRQSVGQSNFGTWSLLAGSITATGTSDGLTTAAQFTSATWMTGDGATNLYVADNGNAIRKITSAGTVTTLAGSITASGDTDGVGTAARFRNISGLAYSSGFLYVSEGAAAHRIRKVDVTTGSVTIWAGALTPTSGYVDAVGTAARFNTPIGIEYIDGMLYVGDTSNNRIRRIVVSSASVTTFAGASGASAANGLVPDSLALALLPSVTVRSVYLPTVATPASGMDFATYLAIECAAPNSSLDFALVQVPSPTSAIVNQSTDQYVYHIARSPDSLPTATTGPMKLDTFGPDAYSMQDVRAADTIGGAVFTTSEQPRILDLYTRVNATDAMPRLRSLGITAPEAPSCTTTTGSTFAANSAWAYRYLCGLKLPNGRIALGPPSERVIVTTGSSVAGSVTMFPSPGLPYDGLPFVQLYRTLTTSSSLTDPGDVMFLCNEQPLTYGQGVVVTDLCSDDLLGAELYTNQYAFGAQAASLPPPAYANEVAPFGQSCVFADFIPAASCRVKVLGTSPLVSGTSTITLTTTGPGSNDACNTLVINFNSAATDPSIKRAQIASSGSAAQNAVQTAKNIVRVINRCADAFMFRAFYDESDPGSFVVYSQYPGSSRTKTTVNVDTGTHTVNQSQITFATNAATAFATIARVPSQRQINTLSPSDAGDVDSYPVINQTSCGPSNEAILRCLPLAESLLIVKDRTIYRCDSSYSLEIYETALSCSLPNSFARLNNQWIGLFNAGFRALTSSQAVAIGRQIDRRVTSYYSAGSYFSGNFACGAASDRQGIYLCSFNKQVFAYSSYGASAWGAFTMPYTNQPSWIGSHQDAFMPVIADYPRGLFWQIDRNNNSTELAASGYDFMFYDATISMVTSATVTSSASVPVTLVAASTPLGIDPSSYIGGKIVVSSFVTAEIIADAGNHTFTLDQAVTLANGASVTVYMPIEIVAQYAPSLAPGLNSQFGDIGVTLERARAGSLTCTFYNRKDVVTLSHHVIPIGSMVYPYGQYDSDDGVARTNVMSEIGSSFLDVYSYYDFQRFATPAERSQDQTMAIALSNRQALAPLAIKSVVIELTEGGKVKQ